MIDIKASNVHGEVHKFSDNEAVNNQVITTDKLVARQKSNERSSGVDYFTSFNYSVVIFGSLSSATLGHSNNQIDLATDLPHKFELVHYFMGFHKHDVLESRMPPSTCNLR